MYLYTHIYQLHPAISCKPRVAPAVSNFAFTAVASKEIRELSAGANLMGMVGLNDGSLWIH